MTTEQKASRSMMNTALVDAALQRIDAWSTKPLATVTAPHEWQRFSAVSSPLADAIRALDDAQRRQLRRALADPSASPSALLADRLIRWIHRRNQFVSVGATARRAVQSIYDDGFRRALDHDVRSDGDTGITALLTRHGWAIRSAILTLTSGMPVDVVSARYRPATQLRILGLDLSEIRGPVLDIGCGQEQHLVRHLRSLDIEAHGLDREIGGTAHDWLAFDPGSACWQTLIAHQSFSLHFTHHHLAASDSTALEYANAFMRYLHALRPGGTFAYAPSIPFIEAALPPDRWEVQLVRQRFDAVVTTATKITRKHQP